MANLIGYDIKEKLLTENDHSKLSLPTKEDDENQLFWEMNPL